MDIKEKIQALILQNNLGSQVIGTEKIVGGLSHNMYRVETDKALFAIKELNPAIMRRKEAYDNFVFSERVARFAKQNGINAVCALQFNGEVVLKIEDSFFVVFDWLRGETLTAEQVKVEHCEIIGKTLAEIHNINFFELQNVRLQNMQAEIFDFESYVPPAKERNKAYAQNLQNSIPLLIQYNKQAAQSIQKLNGVLTISHADLDRKNVMWQNFTPFLIDWESSGCINPTLELVQVAWYWAGGDVENLDRNKFERLIKSYVEEYNGKTCADYTNIVCANLSSKLAWLEYNLKRSMNETKFESSEMACREVVKSLKEINYCVSQFDNVVNILKSCF